MTAKNGVKLTTKQRAALDALAAGMTQNEAALAADTSTRTLQRWLTDDAFLLELRRLQRLASDAHVRALSAELASNRDVVVSARDDVNASWHVRLKAAAMLEDSLLRWLDVAEFEERLRALEDALGHETN